ncbi:unnamed protein product [Acanthosepion pharaonis]|uniref:Uncharacterized protein n=1 Tax=Acanthosepion pharaonis TaxID=158019 RepID=A0A812B4U5_ACAPH|nr:unnamed protein product [Sepia pharaonis]
MWDEGLTSAPSVRYEGKKGPRVPGADYNVTITGRSAQRPHATSQSQEERANCLARKAAYRASLRSRLKNAQRSRMKTQAAAIASASRTSETHHQRLLRNVRNAAATAKSKAIETLGRRRARQSRDAAATVCSRAAETPLRWCVRNARNTTITASRGKLKHLTAGALVNTGTLLQQLSSGSPRQSCNSQCPQRCQKLQGPKDKGKQTFKGCYKHGRCALISNSPSSPHTPRRRHSAPCGRSWYYLSHHLFWSFLAFNYDPGINVGSMTRVC